MSKNNDWMNEREMSPRQYKAAITEFGMNISESARFLGRSVRTARRYTKGLLTVRTSEALLLRSMIAHRDKPIVPVYDGDDT